MTTQGRLKPSPSGRSSGIRAAFPLERLGAVIFDMDGVVTHTAAVHFAAWKQVFDAFLAERAAARQNAGGLPAPDRSASDLDPYRSFDEEDYRRYVDGKPREAGVRDFLASRGIVLPEGRRGDGSGAPSVAGLGLRKNVAFLERAASHGVKAFPTTLSFVNRLTAMGRRVAVISASENATEILSAAGVLGCFEVKVDGIDSRRLHLPGKPDPGIFLEAARRLGVSPSCTAIVEDALAGVEAGARGGFGFVLAVDRAGFAPELTAAGASLVVRDLGELLETV